jgi:predicted secreted protein
MASSGNAVTITLGTSAIAGINNIGFDTALDQLDVTDFDSAGGREFIPGLSGATMSLAGDYEPTDTSGQTALVNAWKNKTLLTGVTAPKFTTDGTNGFSADAYVSSMSINPTVEGKVTATYTLQLTGDINIETA